MEAKQPRKQRPGKRDREPWYDNSKQFPRLIGELMAVGAFTPEVMASLSDEMDLPEQRIWELIERAQSKWDAIKSRMHSNAMLAEREKGGGK